MEKSWNYVFEFLWEPCRLRLNRVTGAQWLSGRMHDSRPVLEQPRKTCPYITERLLMGRIQSNQTNKDHRSHCVMSLI